GSSGMGNPRLRDWPPQWGRSTNVRHEQPVGHTLLEVRRHDDLTTRSGRWRLPPAVSARTSCVSCSRRPIEMTTEFRVMADHLERNAKRRTAGELGNESIAFYAVAGTFESLPQLQKKAPDVPELSRKCLEGQ